MELSKYRNFDEKKEICNCIQIHKISELKCFREKLSSGGYIFRGMREAKWKNYTSAQREWITKELYLRYKKKDSFNLFINKLLQLIKKEKILCSYLKSIGVIPNDLYYLSLMQHYGCPTPLLDFTHNFDVALYFAFENMQWNFSSNEIENYVSIYYISLPQIKQEAADILQIARKAALTNEENKMNIINKEEFSHVDTLMPWYSKNSEKINISDFNLSFLSPTNESVYIEPTNESLYCSNLNQIAQEGCFLIYPIKDHNSQFLSLEEFLNSQYQQYHNELKGNGIRSTSAMEYPRLNCVNIHKSLYEYITNTKEIRKHFTSKDSIFPSMNDMVRKVYCDFQRL